ncbi:MAG TPA: HIT domain-containing protein, partial [Thermoanaerobaculia bacterium]|nr:HIT domain-containing protein [Thermoanaerobaculia bacterium]
MESLFTPWRYDYIKTKGRDEGCFLCAAAAELDEPERLVVFAAAHHLVMLNRHPYTNGHLMVAPLAHHASPRQEDDAAQAELWPLVLAVQEVLEEDLSPDGFNLGLNLGRAAGAGVPGHFHLHVVPRWQGDTNFMGVVAGVRMVPQALDDSWRRLRRRFARFADDPRFAPAPAAVAAEGGGE